MLFNSVILIQLLKLTILLTVNNTVNSWRKNIFLTALESILTSIAEEDVIVIAEVNVNDVPLVDS